MVGVRRGKFCETTQREIVPRPEINGVYWEMMLRLAATCCDLRGIYDMIQTLLFGT